LPGFACPEALVLAESLLAVDGVREEAQAAVAAIKESLGRQKNELAARLTNNLALIRSIKTRHGGGV